MLVACVLVGVVRSWRTCAAVESLRLALNCCRVFSEDLLLPSVYIRHGVFKLIRQQTDVSKGDSLGLSMDKTDMAAPSQI